MQTPQKTGGVERIIIDGYKYPFFWDHSKQYGYLHSDGYDYDEEYFEHYKKLENSKMAEELNEERKNFIYQVLDKDKIRPRSFCDVGIGSGIFCKKFDCVGFDINPVGVNWLLDEGRYFDPNIFPIYSTIYWDALEHIDDPTKVLNNTIKWVFVSCPIYEDLHHALHSKHFKPGEHIWYWTEPGLITFMRDYGFELKHKDDFETRLGREDIFTYAFRKYC